jgi:hypothetical protein
MNTEIYFDKSEEKLIICDKTSAETECEMICHFHKKIHNFGQYSTAKAFWTKRITQKKLSFSVARSKWVCRSGRSMRPEH